VKVPDWAKPYLDDADHERDVWEEAGKRWADRNPTDAEETDASWVTQYGCKKTDVVRSILRGYASAETSWLEAGCSAGAHMRVMEAAGWPDIDGCDVSVASMRDLPRTRYGDLAKLPCEDQSYDGITTSGTLMHMLPESRLLRVLAEINRVARWAFLSLEVWQPSTRVVTYDDVLPPSIMCPWERTLPLYMHRLGWSLVCSRLVLPVKRPDRGSAFPISVNLMTRLPGMGKSNADGIWTLWQNP
jgi:hypothetical protein